MQVSLAGLPGLLSSTRSQSFMATGGLSAGSTGPGAPSAVGSIMLSEEEMANIRCASGCILPIDLQGTEALSGYAHVLGAEYSLPCSAPGLKQQSV